MSHKDAQELVQRISDKDGANVWPVAIRIGKDNPPFYVVIVKQKIGTRWIWVDTLYSPDDLFTFGYQHGI